MANAKTGILSALGAIAGGALGAFVGSYAVQMRPRGRRRPRTSSEIEDAMVIGGAAGATLGAFVAGTVAGEEEVPKQLIASR